MRAIYYHSRMAELPQYAYRDGTAQWSQQYIAPIVYAEARSVIAHIECPKVIDLGCGNGFLLRHCFLGLPRTALYGIDGSHSGIEHARQSVPAGDFRVGDVCGEFSDHPAYGKCDLLISTEVVEHLYNPRTFALNCFNFLRPGGRALISTPYHGYLKNLALSLSGRMDAHFGPLWDGGHIKFWSRRTLSQLFMESGFLIRSFHGAGRLPLLWKSMILILERPASGECQQKGARASRPDPHDLSQPN